MTTKNYKRGVTRRASQNKAPGGEIQKSQIPPYISDPVFSVAQRYYVNSSGSDPYSFQQELPIVPWAFSTSTTILRPPFKAVRLARIRMWCVYRNSVGIEGNTINLTIVERRGIRPIEFSDTASYQCNAYIDKKFSVDDQLGWYYSQSTGETNPEIIFHMPKGAVMELTLCYVMDDNDTANSVTTAGLTADKVYTNSLDAKVSVIGKTFQTPIVV